MRYIIGVDLGTTNSCVSFVDTHDPKLAIQPFRIPQMDVLGHIETLPSLPSFCYSGADQKMPWGKKTGYVVGAFARQEGAKTPTKLVESAKSWLCHTAVNRHDKLLPHEAANPSDRISPVEASARYLLHLRQAWNHLKAKGQDDAIFEEQDIMLTVPASFDETARALTVEAAKHAGIKQLTLLEEPQAAFYSWLAQNEKTWNETFKAGEYILVCDVGGGTTDFSLIEVTGSDGALSLQRMAVGDHLLLGGDNMDVAVARLVEQRIFAGDNRELSINQWLQLKHQAREAKETLLDDDAVHEMHRFLLQGTGAKIVAQTLSADIGRQELQEQLVGGFFPVMEWEEAVKLQRSAGVKTMGLPYEAEPAITKHLAGFLSHAADRPIAPDYILFNGGTMKPAIFREAVLNSLQRWFPDKQVTVLSSYHLDLAVCRGAAYYGRVRRGLGVRIGGGSARGYYLGVDTVDASGVKEAKAMTLLPRGSEEGASYEPEQIFMLRPNVPVSFTIYTSHVRLHDAAGTLLAIDPNEMQPLPPIQTVLRFGKASQEGDRLIPVRLGIRLSEIGTIELWLQAQETSHRWNLEFQLRTSDGKEQTSGMTTKDETFDSAFLEAAKEKISVAFSPMAKTDLLMEYLEECLGLPRREWSPSILRGLWETTRNAAAQRKSLQATETRWWNLAGFLLRPGFGYPLDDFRLKEVWKIVLADLKTPLHTEAEVQRWICLRRIAGGLNRGQQAQVAAELWPQLIDKQTGKIVLKGKAETYQYTEKLRAAASMELVDPSLKVKLGNAILARIAKETPLPVEFWALGRLGARHLFHGSAAHVVNREIAAEWATKLLKLNERTEQWLFAIGHIARKTDQRELNLSPDVVKQILQMGDEESKQLKTFLTDAVPFTQNEQDRVFGEQLPAGLMLQL